MCVHRKQEEESKPCCERNARKQSADADDGSRSLCAYTACWFIFSSFKCTSLPPVGCNKGIQPSQKQQVPPVQQWSSSRSHHCCHQESSITLPEAAKSATGLLWSHHMDTCPSFPRNQQEEGCLSVCGKQIRVYIMYICSLCMSPWFCCEPHWATAVLYPCDTEDPVCNYYLSNKDLKLR